MKKRNIYKLIGFVVVFHWATTALSQRPVLAGHEKFRVIVHPHNSTTLLDRQTLTNLFLKKVKFWKNGEVVLPVDLDQGNSIRSHFSEEILNRSITAIRMYWQQMIFTGRDLPPLELQTDQAVLKYITTHEAAIGYISAETPANGVKVIQIE